MMQKSSYSLLWLVFPVGAGLLYPYIKENPQYLEWMTTGLLLFVLFFSVVIHELCHGLAANWCGDPTAKDAGRLTLNPISHVSPVGSILVPLGLHLMQASFVFGWAKPVPFNPVKLRQHPRDQVMLAVAGPLSNFTLSYLAFNLYLIAGMLFNRIFPNTPIEPTFDIFSPMTFQDVPFEAFWFVLFEILNFAMLINIVLGVFNLIPFPPLDGSWILKAILPKKAAAFFGKVQMLGFILLIVAVKMGLLQIFFYPAMIIFGIYQGIFMMCF